jgi:hypothetical protein
MDLVVMVVFCGRAFYARRRFSLFCGRAFFGLRRMTSFNQLSVISQGGNIYLRAAAADVAIEVKNWKNWKN